MTAPRATYRLQLSRDFTFDDAAAIIPYLKRLGISHAYFSPYLVARSGSPHGYDITDHNALNPELGGAEGFERLHDILSQNGLSQILDFVPNHMGVGRSDNPWWLDVMEWGRNSPYAGYFDIDWEPAKPELRGKVLLPFFGDYYGKVLEAGELQLRYAMETGTFQVVYHEHIVPIGPRHYPRILGDALSILRGSNDDAVERMGGVVKGFAQIPAGLLPARRRDATRARADGLKAELAVLTRESHGAAYAIAAAVERINGQPGTPSSFTALHSLLDRQAYRLSYWKVAANEINYRRFFDVNDLAGLRVELPGLFDLIHRLVFRLIDERKLDGLRIDHVDGLFDPRTYCRRVKARIGDRYLVVEKILAEGEPLPEDWPIDGITGYDFMNEVLGLFVDPKAARPLSALYRRFSPVDWRFGRILYESKKEVMEHLLPAELQVLSNELDGIAEANWHSRDITMTRLRDALAEVVACFPVYRSYVTERGADGLARRIIGEAAAEARGRSHMAPEVFAFIESVLTGDFAGGGRRNALRRRVLRFAMKVQQYTAPVMAKGSEDTAFYRFHRLIALNEVGGDPRRLGVSIPEFHRACVQRCRRWPHAMVTTMTHDAKRGEDVRARLCVLTEMPEDWERSVRGWRRLNRRLKARVEGAPAPDSNDEYLLYQTLVGTWPVDWTGKSQPPAEALRHYRERIAAYMIKAAREAKLKTSWSRPDQNYEAGVTRFVEALLEGEDGGPFREDFADFQARIATLGVVNGLAQCLIRLTTPGVPDCYQGSELWDLRLVDPDNRAAVDFRRRDRMLQEMERDFAEAADTPQLDELMASWPDGRIKLFLIWRALALRNAEPRLFSEGGYQPLAGAGPAAGHLYAFARTLKDRAAVVVVPRLASKLSPEDWAATSLALAALGDGWTWQDALSRRAIGDDHDQRDKSLRLRPSWSCPLWFLSGRR